jgi:LAO/AO transport system kinase
MLGSSQTILQGVTSFVVQKTIDSMRSGDRRALARLLTLVERDDLQVRELMQAIHPHIGGTYTVGITGPPGAGKSTLVDGLLTLLRRDGNSVGVLAADPTSPFTGGAVLGDRVRMQKHYLDPEVFIRSLATRGSHGGLPEVTMRAIRVLAASVKDYVLVETVGVGQTELDIVGMADTVIVTLVPEAGDAVQTMKAGLMEVADIFVVNKSDRPGATQLETALRAMLTLDPRRNERRIPVILTEAHYGKGLEELYQSVLQHQQEQTRTHQLTERRQARYRQEFLQTISKWVESRVVDLAQQSEEFGQLIESVDNGNQDPYAAAKEVLENAKVFQNWIHTNRID